MSTRSITFAIITSLITTFTSSAYGSPLFLGRFKYIVKIHRKRFLSNVNFAHLAALLLFLVSVKAYSGVLEPAPSIDDPAIPTETTVALEWSVTPSIKGKTTYTIQYCSTPNEVECADYINAISTKSLNGVVQNLTPGTDYFFRIYARDAHGNDATGPSIGPITTDGEPPVVGQDPDLTIQIFITSGDPFSAVDDEILYSYLVTNIGNKSLSGPVIVDDDQATNESCSLIGALEPGATVTCNASHTVNATDILNGVVVNIATASADGITSLADTKVASSSQCDYPTFGGTSTAFVDLEGLEFDFSPPSWANADAVPIFFDEFNPPGATESWIIEDMHDSLNQAGNAGIDEGGQWCSDCRPYGKRWSAWYDEHWPETISGFSAVDANVNGVNNVSSLGGGENGVLELGGRQISGLDIDPTRPGAGQWNNNRLYTAWIKTWARDPDDTDIESGANTSGQDKWTAPMYLETKVNFAKMNTPGFRLSMWMMPATYDEGGSVLATGNEAYDGNFKNGFEIDIFEFEPWSPVCRGMVEFAWHNSFATRGKRGQNANGKFHLNGIDANEWHTIGFLWETDRMQWVFEGKVVLEITDPAKIPTIYQYLNLSREMTNGFIDGQATFNQEGTYFLPPEGGLYGYEGSSKLGNYFGSINNDKAVIDYVKIYQQ